MGYGLLMQQIKAVIFDLGETLLNFERVSVSQLFFKGAQLTYDYLKEHFGSSGKLGTFRRYHLSHVFSLRWNVLKARLSCREFDCLALLDYKLKVLGLRAGKEQLMDLAQLWYDPLRSRATIESGLHDYLRALKGMHLKLAILSNTFIPAVVMDRHLQEFELLEFFSVRVYSSDTIYRKPDKRIYQEALKQLEVSPSEAVMVGDKLDMDIRGAGRVGIKSIFKRGVVNRKKRLGGDITVIESIGDLPVLLGDGFGRFTVTS